MNIEFFRDYCLAKQGVTEEFPFDRDTLVFKVMNKIFVLTDVDQFESVNLKCDPERAIELREINAGIKPGFHMNKKHWNTVETTGIISDNLLKELIDHSYSMVVKGLAKTAKEQLKNL